MRYTGLWLLVVLLFSALPAWAERREALVIGNAAYRHAGELANPLNDARKVAEALRGLGFGLGAGPVLNADRAAMEAAIRAFRQRSQGADVALLYYSGHGLQIDQQNRLVPVDAELSHVADVNLETLALADVLVQLGGAVNVLVLDACRDNPFARSLARSAGQLGRSLGLDKGMARITSDALRGGSLLALAAAPGEVALDGPAGANSPYAEALVNRLRTPGADNPTLDIRLLFDAVGEDVDKRTQGRQRPETVSRLPGRAISLALPGTVAPATKPVVPVVGTYPAGHAVGAVFRDCADCPEMVVVPAGSYDRGSPKNEVGRGDDEAPVRRVTIPAAFAVGRYEVSFAEWDACVVGGGCGGYRPVDEWGRGNQPVIRVSWQDAKTYIAWLSRKTGERYRLLTEAEWEYVARAGTQTPFWTGATISTDQANYDGDFAYVSGRKGTDRNRTVAVDSFAANPLGLYNVHGNVSEWVQDCYVDKYPKEPVDGTAVEGPESCPRALRGGSWGHNPNSMRSASRHGYSPDLRFGFLGFRLARMLSE